MSSLNENWHTLIPNPDLDFWNSYLKIHFWANLGPKILNCLFRLKIGEHSISSMLIPNPGLDFENFDPKSIFWQIWDKKVKVVRFNWKLAHMISRGCWFLSQHLFYGFPTLNSFLAKFGPKKSKFLFCL